MSLGGIAALERFFQQRASGGLDLFECDQGHFTRCLGAATCNLHQQILDRGKIVLQLQQLSQGVRSRGSIPVLQKFANGSGMARQVLGPAGGLLQQTVAISDESRIGPAQLQQDVCLLKVKHEPGRRFLRYAGQFENCLPSFQGPVACSRTTQHHADEGLQPAGPLRQDRRFDVAGEEQRFERLPEPHPHLGRHFCFGPGTVRAL